MRHSLTDFTILENLPECPNCGAATVFTSAAELKDNRVYMIFLCPNCDAGETKVWRPEWQHMAEALETQD